MLPWRGSSSCCCLPLLFFHQLEGELLLLTETEEKQDQRISAAAMLMPMKLQLIAGVTSSPLTLLLVGGCKSFDAEELIPPVLGPVADT